ncbi:glycoside hydrolase superfamily [Aspergillus nidulans var. acristatus]
MPIDLTCYPPLGKVTCLEADKVRFTVLIEPASQGQYEIQIWHNIGLSEWAALPLSEHPSAALPALSSRQDPGYRGVFAGEITCPQAGTGRFIVRYREDSGAEWRWANKERGYHDGELVFVSRGLASELAASSAQDFANYFDGLSPDIQVEVRKSEAPGAALWKISGPVEEARDGHSGILRLPLGIPSSMSRFFALARVETSWLGPRQGKGKLNFTEDAILFSFLRTDGVHVVLLGVTVDDTTTVLGSGQAGEVVIKSQNDNATPSRFQVLAAVAADFEVATSALIYEARKLVRPYENTAQGGPRTQWLSEWYDGLAYCTWNGLGQDLSEEKILSALDDLKTAGIRIRTLIIDDNWQSLDNEGADSWHRGWTQFEANPKAFPNGLAKTVSTIREQHRNIEYILVWHALFGYWGGISPEGSLAAIYKTREVTLNSTIRPSMLTIDPSDIQRFYNDFYAFLSRSGISGVKTDAQSFLDLLADPEDRRSYANAYQDAWTISSLRHFGPKAISCMSQIPQTIFHSQLPTNKPTIVVRNSNDFFPDIDDSHTWHVFCNAHNALLTRYLNVLPDWDMFQTLPANGPDYASFHAAARCISGGPIDITDKPGQHDIQLIKQMTASTIQGTTITLRPDIAARTLDMYHDIREGHILCVGTYHGGAGSGSGIIGVFNVSNSFRSVIMPVADFPGIYDDQEETGYIVRAHRTGRIVGKLHASSTVSVTLNERRWEVLTAYPVKTLTFAVNSIDNENEKNMPTADVSVDIAILGLLRKMTGVAALVSSDIYIEDTGRLRVDVGIKALGVLGIYFSCLQEWDIDEHFMVLVSGKPVPRKTVWKEDGRVLAIDVEEAWHGLGLEAGWGNEVWISVLM